MRNSEDLLQIVADLLEKTARSQDKGCFSTDTLHLTGIPADGSTRFFFRVTGEEEAPICVGVLPSKSEDSGMSEAASAVAIGRHLHARGVAVPEILAACPSTGLILFEDCGDISLQKVVAGIRREESPEEESRIFSHYRRVLDNLAYMQVHGKKGFNTAWCYDTGEYDRELMLLRESGYFYQAFWRDLLAGGEVAGIEEEFEAIAERAAGGMGGYFLHRDFQSRNILLSAGQPKFIDYQGGRMGPPGYDLASLLIDPYVGLSEEMQDMLLDYYLEALHTQIDFEERVFIEQYGYLSLQRNLQILGAFAFLYKRRGKPFFRAYLKPSLNSLAYLLLSEKTAPYRRLSRIVDEAYERLEEVLAEG